MIIWNSIRFEQSSLRVLLLLVIYLSKEGSKCFIMKLPLSNNSYSRTTPTKIFESFRDGLVGEVKVELSGEAGSLDDEVIVVCEGGNGSLKICAVIQNVNVFMKRNL